MTSKWCHNRHFNADPPTLCSGSTLGLSGSGRGNVLNCKLIVLVCSYQGASRGLCCGQQSISMAVPGSPLGRRQDKGGDAAQSPHCAQGLQAAPLQGSGWAAVCPDASRVGKASSDHFRPNDIDGNENFVRLERLLKGFWRSESVFSVLFFIPCPSTRPDRHLCLLPPETETG